MARLRSGKIADLAGRPDYGKCGYRAILDLRPSARRRKGLAAETIREMSLPS
jgi:hypothetical protein